MENLIKSTDDKKVELTEYIQYLSLIGQKIAKYDDKLSYYIANGSLLPEAEGSILVITGFLPKKQIKDVETFLKKEDVLVIRGPVEYVYKGNTACTIDFKDLDGYVIEVSTRSHK